MKRSVPQKRRKVMLVGQPNVGKSALFSSLTGRLATISNYPGTTIEVFRAVCESNGDLFEVIDTPGIESLNGASEAEKVTRALLEREEPAVIVQVTDGKNLGGALLLTFELAKLGHPLVLNLNMEDERAELGTRIDSAKLSGLLGIPVLETVATRGDGLDRLCHSFRSRDRVSLDGSDPGALARSLVNQVRSGGSSEVRTGIGGLLTLASATGAVLHFSNYLVVFGAPTLARALEERIVPLDQFPLLGLTASIFGAYLLPVLLPVLWGMRSDPLFRQRLGRWSRLPLTGIPILILTLSMVYQLVGVIGAQVLVAVFEDGLFGGFLTPFLEGLLPAGWIADLMVGRYGLFSVGLTYGVAIVLPVVSTFFLAFSFLEDSGYLPRLSLLSDRLFVPLGLNGKAFLPMVLGLGCVTMATLTTRILPSRKERLIATFLLALGVPCSAQLGVVLGLSAGLSVAVLVVVVSAVAIQIGLMGALLARLLPGQRSDFILALPPIRFPIWRNIVGKTWLRVRWFLREALPLFVLGALLLFTLEEMALLERIVGFAEPIVVGLLDLPRQTATVFLLGFLRRDYGAAGLFELARNGDLTAAQTAVSLTVTVLFVPCLANLLVMVKEHGVKIAAAMTLFICLYAIAVGGVLSWLLRVLEFSV